MDNYKALRFDKKIHLSYQEGELGAKPVLKDTEPIYDAVGSGVKGLFESDANNAMEKNPDIK